MLYVLGRVPNSTSWEPLGHPDHPAPVPGVVVVQLVAPLYYANAELVRTEIRAATMAPTGVASAGAGSTGAASAVTGGRALVLDADAVSDIDFTGIAMLRSLLDELDHAGVKVAIARAVGDVPNNLARSWLLPRLAGNRVYGTVNDAVAALTT